MDEVPNNKPKGKGSWLAVFILATIIFLPITFFWVLDWVISSDIFSIGITGFIRAAIVNGTLGLLALIAAIMSAVRLVRPDTSLKQKLIRVVVIIICLIVSPLLLRPLFLDIPYINSPQTAYLDRLEFDDEMGIGDSPANYYLRGVDVDGERHSFEISEKRWEEGREMLWSTEDYELFAKVSYLPHTSTLMTLDFFTDHDELLAKLYPSSPGLPEDWESFSIQINDIVYALPTPITAFLRTGWSIAEEDSQLHLAGADQPYSSYEWEWISLTNERDQTISVMAFNTTENTISIAESTVGGIYVIYGNYDFSGTELRIPGGLMLQWSTRGDVLKLYGQPSETYENYRLTYETDGPITGYWNLYFDEAGHLDEVMMHHQNFNRSDDI